ncbi:MAG: nicotinamide phosphoribosyltransferase domain-containing protein, partial [Minisyncoccia bacterium]
MINPIFLKDFYKVGHIEQYPKGTEKVFSNFTPRKALIQSDYVVVFGIQYLLKEYLIKQFNHGFFNNLNAVVEYQDFMEKTLGVHKEFAHIQQLHDLGYLPIEIRAITEGRKVPIGVPILTITNTDPKFFWLPNMLETLISCILWPACTSATIASHYRTLLDRYANETSDNGWFVDYQAHDFSFRGLMGVEAAMLSGAGHLQFFKGTDTIPGIHMLHDYYGTDYSCGTSVNATEHSVMCAG